MEYSFPRYLLAKQTVDDRALNKDVLAALKAALSASDLRFSASRQPSVPDSASDLRFSASSVPDSASNLRFSASRQPSVPDSASNLRFSASSVVNSASSVDNIRFFASRQPSISETDSALRFSASPVHPLSAPLLTVIEVGAGIGTMLTRLLRWNILPPNVDYTLVDEMPENIAFARQWLPQWARENGYQVETLLDASIRLTTSRQPSVPASASSVDDIRFSASRQPSVPESVLVHFVQADVFDFIRFSASQSTPPSADLLIAHAFLDLLPMPESLSRLFSLLKPGGLAWLTINFDGVTIFEPPFRFSDLPRASQRGSSVADLRFSASRQPSVPESVDTLIERLYHQTMDTRPTGGDSRSGRHLFGHLKQAGAEILAAGASDWVVYPVKGQYPADEAYFLHFILHFFETSLANHPELDPDLFQEWLKQRRAQIERAELVYIAHQMDFLISTR